MESIKASVLIGPITRDPTESVGVVNETIAGGLSRKFKFSLHEASRTHGLDRQGGMNLLNILYFFKHLGSWIAGIISSRPRIAHYAITSNWNMEKCLLFLKLARYTGAKTIAHLHGGEFIDFWTTLSTRRRTRALREMEHLDGFVTLSEGWRIAVIRLIGLAPERVHVVHNPIHPDFEHSVLEFEPGRSGVNVLCFGVMDRMKGVLDILGAAARMPPDSPVRFQLVGPEREPGIRAEVEERIRECNWGRNVSILGSVFGDQKIKLFQEASIMLLPSYIENFPVSVIEAAAAGLPLVVTRVGAIPEFFEDEVSALFVDTGNGEQISRAIGRLLKDSDLRLRLASNAREVFTQRLKREKVMEQMASVYHAVLE